MSSTRPIILPGWQLLIGAIGTRTVDPMDLKVVAGSNVMISEIPWQQIKHIISFQDALVAEGSGGQIHIPKHVFSYQDNAALSKAEGFNLPGGRLRCLWDCELVCATDSLALCSLVGEIV